WLALVAVARSTCEMAGAGAANAAFASRNVRCASELRAICQIPAAMNAEARTSARTCPATHRRCNRTMKSDATEATSGRTHHPGAQPSDRLLHEHDDHDDPRDSGEAVEHPGEALHELQVVARSHDVDVDDLAVVARHRAEPGEHEHRGEGTAARPECQHRQHPRAVPR